MNPIDSKLQITGWHNIVYAKDQPEYQPLPAIKHPNGDIISCWKLSFLERINLLFTGKLWLLIRTFNHPLQPILPSAIKFEFEKE